jgi:hypothetical protein
MLFQTRAVDSARRADPIEGDLKPLKKWAGRIGKSIVRTSATTWHLSMPMAETRKFKPGRPRSKRNSLAHYHFVFMESQLGTKNYRKLSLGTRHMDYETVSPFPQSMERRGTNLHIYSAEEEYYERWLRWTTQV